MLIFDKSQEDKLKEFLRHQCSIHDAILVSTSYDRKKAELSLKAFNPYYGTTLYFTFREVKILLSLRGDAFGSPEAIHSLTLEEDFSYLPLKTAGDLSGYLYLLFQMFSMDELHIVAKSVTLECIQ